MPKRIHICPIGKYPQRQEIPARIASTKLRHLVGEAYVKDTTIKNKSIKTNYLTQNQIKGGPGSEKKVIVLHVEDAGMERPFCYKGRPYMRIEIEGLYREEELEIPYKALRECCTNALCHRLYHRPGSSVGIAIYDDRVEIENSGTFPPDMTMEKLLSGHNSEPQNLIIANALYKSEVLENWGRGIGLMVSECRSVGIPDPEFHTDGNSVWVIFRYTRTTVGYDPAATPQLPHSYPTVTPQLPHRWKKCCPQSGKRRFRPKRLWV